MDAGQHFLHAEFALQAILFPGNLPELNEEACQLAHLLHHALPNSYWFRRLTSPQTVVAISDMLNYAVCSAYHPVHRCGTCEECCFFINGNGTFLWLAMQP